MLMAIEATPQLYENARYFVMKSQDSESLDISWQHNVWSTTKRPTDSLINGFRSCSNVILIFSITESGGF